MTEFAELDLIEPLRRAVSDAGYTHATPIQAEAIPQLLTGRDMVGIAQTGTGKTAAFVLPTLQMIAGLKGKPAPHTCRALILAPTRELAAQIVENARAYAKHLRLNIAMVVGGVKPGPQVKNLARGVDLLVATPGRLLDHMAGGALRLDQTHTVVLDEADQMMDLGFIPAIRKIMRNLPAQRQTLLFSATMPKEIRALAADFLNDPAEVKVARVGKPVDAIAQKVIHVAGAEKRDLLLTVLSGQEVERAIVFVRTKRGADKVSEHLEKYGIKSNALHGNKSQGQRDRALKGFKTGRTPVLVATDIAARGIDVDDVSHVVNYDLPNIPDAYVHRIGRTARAGKDGIAISFCEPGETGYLFDIEKLIKMSIPAEGEAPQGPLSREAGKQRRNPRPPRQRQGENGRPQNARPPQNRGAGNGSNDNRRDGGAPAGAKRRRPRRSKPGGNRQAA